MDEVHEVTELITPGPAQALAGLLRVPAASRDRAVTVDPVLLFRFSALTYNAHRIHYDLQYARAEGYPGLVVHGPLQALLMAGQARPFGSEYAYRLVATLYEDDGLVVSAIPDGDAVRVSYRDAADRVTATGVIR
jgi:3-methylfumaryl-CoA hydratase